MLGINGHTRQIKYLRESFSTGRAAHAYLFYGPEGLGKFTLAKNIAKSLTCPEGKVLVNFCGRCSECRNIEEGQSSHVIILDTEHTLTSKKEKRKDIPIEDLREIKRLFSFAPAENSWRIVIINEADKMSLPAANSFLKLLEEPGERILIFLIAPDKKLLLETIVSRVLPLSFGPLPEKEILPLIKRKLADADLQKAALWLSAGRPGRLEKLLSEKSLLTKETDFLKSVGALLREGDFSDIFRSGEKNSAGEETRKKTAEYILRLLREKIIQETARNLRTDSLQKIKKVYLIQEMMEETNVNPRLALEIMLLEAKTK